MDHQARRGARVSRAPTQRRRTTSPGLEGRSATSSPIGPGPFEERSTNATVVARSIAEALIGPNCIEANRSRSESSRSCCSGPARWFRDVPICALRRLQTLQLRPIDAIGQLSRESPFRVIRDWSERSDPLRWTLTRTSHRSGETKALHRVTPKHLIDDWSCYPHETYDAGGGRRLGPPGPPTRSSWAAGMLSTRSRCMPSRWRWPLCLIWPRCTTGLSVIASSCHHR